MKQTEKTTNWKRLAFITALLMAAFILCATWKDNLERANEAEIKEANLKFGPLDTSEEARKDWQERRLQNNKNAITAARKTLDSATTESEKLIARRELEKLLDAQQ